MGAAGFQTFATWQDSARYALALVRFHRLGSFQQNEARSGTNDPRILPTPTADRLYHRRFGTARRSGASAGVRQECTPLV
jgi:hypothetical protein